MLTSESIISHHYKIVEKTAFNPNGMAKSSQEVLFEGWLTKSPPTKRIWRAKWRRRWFSLTQSGELPGQYILTYYADRNCRKSKGVIDLDRCEQVDLGLKHEERELRFDHVFDIKTPTRTYFLAADTEAEMYSWVKNICKVCGLKLTEDEEFHMPVSSGVEIEELEMINNFTETPPISPVSTSPYIPISECITGKSPVFDPKDFKTLAEYNRKNSMLQSYIPNSHINDCYEKHTPHNYYNLDTQDPRYYDSPRQLLPPPIKHKHIDKNGSPLQSPTDSESVFTDDDWVHNTSSDLNTSANTRPSVSSADADIIATQRFTKANAPPRPPKPAHIAPGPCYLNLTPSNTKASKEDDNELTTKSNKENSNVVSDDMYDFPRSHVNANDNEAEKKSTIKRHCYNNAAPSNVEGTIFRYDISPKPCGSTPQIFKYDVEDTQDEPASPHSQSSAVGYSNLPSPLLIENQLMPPPIVNRGLKPKRKVSDSHSISSINEPPSPRGAPSIDRKLKPPTPLQDAHDRKQFNVEDEGRKIRAAPSPTPNALGRSHESLLTNHYEQNDQFLTGKMQYLDLDLDVTTSGSFNSVANGSKTLPLKQSDDSVYKKIDFAKTNAFNLTRDILEKERQEPVTFKK